MGAIRARDVAIKMSDGGSPEQFDVIGGLLARTISLSTRPVEATTAQSPQGWRELIAGGGTKRIEVAGRGWFFDTMHDERVRWAFFNGETPRFALDVFGFGVFKGPFAISELSYGGDNDDLTTFSIRLTSAGAISFVPE